MNKIIRIHKNQAYYKFNELKLAFSPDFTDVQFKKFLNSKEGIKYNSYISFLEIIEKNNTIEQLNNVLESYKNRNKKTSIERMVIKLLNNIIKETTIPDNYELYGEVEIDLKAELLVNSFKKLNSDLENILSKKELMKFDISTTIFSRIEDEYNILNLFNKIENYVNQYDEENDNNIVKETTFLDYDIVIKDSNSSSYYLKYFYESLHQSFKYILLAKGIQKRHFNKLNRYRDEILKEKNKVINNLTLEDFTVNDIMRNLSRLKGNDGMYLIIAAMFKHYFLISNNDDVIHFLSSCLGIKFSDYSDSKLNSVYESFFPNTEIFNLVTKNKLNQKILHAL